MSHERSADAPRPLLPVASPCVWMSAGLIAYKLCDREYACERCPFDAAMRGEPRGEHAVVEHAGPAWVFPDDRLYHPSHVWVRRVGARRVRCGLDVFASRLLGRVATLVLPPRTSRLREGRVACWLRDGATLVPLRAPVSGTVTRLNRDAQQDPGRICASPYDEGWLMELDCREPLDEQPRLRSSREHRERCGVQLEQLSREVARTLGSSSEIGPTLADGGSLWTDLRGLLGSDRYRRLLRRFLD